MLDRSTGNGRHKLADRGHDCYETPAVAVRALLAHETFPRVVWEPACGPGAIARVLMAAGHTVYASDLIDYGVGTAGLNFLTARAAPPGCECIITNPPFRDAEAFVAKALELVPRVAMLLRLAFLEAERKSGCLDDWNMGLKRVHVFKNRLPMMHREGWTGPRSTSATAFGWFCWDRRHYAPATINRIRWEP
jgi:hypothetical protein